MAKESSVSVRTGDLETRFRNADDLASLRNDLNKLRDQFDEIKVIRGKEFHHIEYHNSK